jgi:hypothetical protein
MKTLLALLMLALTSPVVFAGACDQQLVLPGGIPAFIDSHGITVSGIPALMYPLDTIRRNLELTDEVVAKFPRQKVVLIGDGFSPLLPFLRSKNVDAISVDPIYDVEESLTEQHDYIAYIEQNRDRLIAESAATYLQQIPRSSVRSVYSHMVISSILDSKTRTTIFTETAAVLECGGSARFAWYGIKESEVAYRAILNRAFRQDATVRFRLEDNGLTDLIRSLESSLNLLNRQRAQPEEWILPQNVRVQYLDIWRECPEEPEPPAPY